LEEDRKQLVTPALSDLVILTIKNMNILLNRNSEITIDRKEECSDRHYEVNENRRQDRR